MRWLQWSQYDLAHGKGGVEAHARCLDRELKALGVDSEISSDPKIILKNKWDVIQTHGSASLPGALHSFRPLRVHTLHGSTLGRMFACREWFWPGGYLAYGREWIGISQSQVVLGVRPDIHLLNIAKRIGKKTAVCWNGWDQSRESIALDEKIQIKTDKIDFYFCYIGRGSDPVKNTPFLEEVFQSFDGAKLVVVPGKGFHASSNIISTDSLEPPQVEALLSSEKCLGLLLCSHYEGLPLVVLEALGNGVLVFSTEVGGLDSFREVQGLNLLPLDQKLWVKTLENVVKGNNSVN